MWMRLSCNCKTPGCCTMICESLIFKQTRWSDIKAKELGVIFSCANLVWHCLIHSILEHVEELNHPLLKTLQSRTAQPTYCAQSKTKRKQKEEEDTEFLIYCRSSVYGGADIRAVATLGSTPTCCYSYTQQKVETWMVRLFY